MSNHLDVEATQADVLRRLGGVDDPCSVAMGTPLSIVDLGLVRAVVAGADGAVTVTIAPTSPGCMVLPRIAEAVHDAALSASGVTRVEVAVDHGFAWSHHAMAEGARTALQQRRDRMVRELDIRPQQWKQPRSGGPAPG
jgi:metal-sulfur cluster biosynthetic enzyme